MAIFSFKVCSHIKGNKEEFRVSVSTDNKIYIRLKNGSMGAIDLEKTQSLIFKFINSKKKHAYLNWDKEDPQDKDRVKRHHVNEINEDTLSDFETNHPNFILSKEEDDILSWRVTCNAETCKADKKGKVSNEENVPVTFGEDQPPTFK